MEQVSDIAIVILNWNGRNWLEQFLPSVIKHSQGAAIYVADNASTDDSVSFVNTNFPSVRILQNTSNGGFAKGYNEALQFVEEKFYLLLNSDIEVTENWLSPLLKAFDNPKVAAVQPKILSFYKRTHFEHAGACGGMIDAYFYPFCRGRILETVEKDTHQYDYETEIFWATGACMLIRKEVYQAVGGLDEDFFAHMEEIDMCWRIKKRGYSIRVIPSSTVYHVGGGTLNYQSPQKTYLNFRNSLFMILKNYEGNALQLFAKLFGRLVLDGVAGIFFTLKGKPKHTIAILKAHFSFYAMFPKMKSKREKGAYLPFNKMGGVYRASLLWSYYIIRIHQFSKLNFRRLK